MAYLFIDSTYDITLGILDAQTGWSRFERFLGQKASSVLQKETHHLLESIQLSMTDIEGIVTVAGPGFYTGLRLSEGFADVLQFLGKPKFSFFSYDIPYWSGVTEGVWMTKAYRGEYFFHHWKDSEHQNILIATKDLASYVQNLGHVFIHSESAIDEQARVLLKSYQSSCEIIKTYPELLQKMVIGPKLLEESFYFRAPEDEFKVSP